MITESAEEVRKELAEPFMSADFPDLSLVALGDERGNLPSFDEWGMDAGSQESLNAFMALAGGVGASDEPSPETPT